MSHQTLLKICIVVAALAAALFAFAAVRTISQMWALLPLPILLVLMSYVPAIMFLLAGLTGFHLARYRKRAVLSAGLLATSPAWPPMLSLFDTNGLFGDLTLLPLGALIWTVIFGAIAFTAHRLTLEGVLK